MTAGSSPKGIAMTSPNAGLVERRLERAWTDFLDANPDDLTSPEELPDHALMTCDQFVQYAIASLPPQTDNALVEALREWALNKSSTHHRLAHDNPSLRSEHIASSTAYRNLADEIAALAAQPQSRGQHNG